MFLVGNQGRTLCGGCGKKLRTPPPATCGCLPLQLGCFPAGRPLSTSMPESGRTPGPGSRPHGESAGPDQACFNQGLLDMLCSLSGPTAEQACELVSGFVEPLEVLRETVRRWQDRFRQCSDAVSAAEDVLLMLDPQLCCGIFFPTKPTEPVAECCGELPGPFTAHTPFVLSGKTSTYRLESPPGPSFCYPYIGGAPLAASKRQAAFVEAACDALGAAWCGGRASSQHQGAPRGNQENPGRPRAAPTCGVRPGCIGPT